MFFKVRRLLSLTVIVIFGCHEDILCRALLHWKDLGLLLLVDFNHPLNIMVLSFLKGLLFHPSPASLLSSSMSFCLFMYFLQMDHHQTDNFYFPDDFDHVIKHYSYIKHNA